MRCAFAVGIALVATSSLAEASPSARLVYARGQDTESCPDEDGMRRAVAARFGYDPFFAWAKQTVVVQLWRERSRYRSRVQFVNVQGISTGTRELSSDRDACAELFDATALAISIALDASALDVSGPAEPDGATSPPAPEPPPAVPAAPEIAPPDPESRRVGHEAAARGFAAFDVTGSDGTAPSPAMGIAAYLGVRLGAPSAALEARVDAPASIREGDGRNITAWVYAAGLLPCVHFGPGSACLQAQLGQWRASSSGVGASSQGTALFAAVGARLGGEVALTEALAVEAHAALLVDLDPPTLRLKGTADEWTAPVPGGALGAGLLLRFP